MVNGVFALAQRETTEFRLIWSREWCANIYQVRAHPACPHPNREEGSVRLREIALPGEWMVMNVFWSTGYGVILLIWRVAFELVGLALVIIIQCAIQRDERRMDRTLPSGLSDVACVSPEVSDQRPAAGTRR
jgi:hypothetical protein